MYLHSIDKYQSTKMQKIMAGQVKSSKKNTKNGSKNISNEGNSVNGLA